MDGGGGTKMVSLLLIDVSKLALSDNTIIFYFIELCLSIHLFLYCIGMYLFTVTSEFH
jgi:hypothetical protein